MRKIYLLLFAAFFFVMLGFSQTPTNILEESFEGAFPPPGWTLINNGNGNPWTQSTSNAFDGSKAMFCNWNFTNPADAWAFTPSLYLNTNPCYITFYVRSGNQTTWFENLKLTVGAGNTIGAQTTTLLDTSLFQYTTYRQWSAVYTPSAAGNFNFAFNCYSAANQDGVYIDSITISQLLPVCTGTPIPGVPFSTDTTICPNKSFSLGVTGTTTGVGGLSFQWQSSTDSVSWTDISGATNKNYTETAGLTANTFYRLGVSCGSGAFVYSKGFQVHVKAAILCPCGPPTNTNIGGFGSPWIDSVSIQNTVLQYGPTSHPSNYYTYRSDVTKIPTLAQGVTYNLLTNFSATAIASVWIDFDQSGTFDATEWVQICTNATTGLTQITVPANATLGQTLMRVRSRANGNQNGAGDACLVFGSGETEDFLVNIGVGTACTGKPAGGLTTSPKLFICPSVAFTVDVSNASTGVTGLSYQWQSSPDSINWSDIAGANSTNYVEASGITVKTYYRRIILCATSNKADTSKSLAIDLNPTNLCYCGPNTGTVLHSFQGGPSIDSVAITGTAIHVAHKGFGPNGYTLDTTTANLQQGLTYTLVVNFSQSAASGLWIDWDQSGTFDQGEYYQVSTSGTTSTITFTVPPTAVLGKTGLRIRCNYYFYTLTGANACTTYTSGETEDYNVNVTAGVSCSGKPAGGITTTAVNPICPNVTFSLKVANSTTGVIGLTYQWQSSPDNKNWSDIVGETNDTTLVNGGIASLTYYRRITICNGSAVDTARSWSIGVDINPTYLCPCSPYTGTTLHTSSGFPTLDSAAIVGTKLHIGSKGAPANGYTIHTDTATIPVLTQALTYNLYAQASTAPFGAGVWVDWNQDGYFDPSEFINLNFNGNTSVTTPLPVPANAVVGTTLMRIRVYGGTITSGSACTRFFSGETEDYLVIVKQGAVCLGKPTGGTTTTAYTKVCPTNTSVIVNVTNSSVGVIGLTYQWQDSTAGSTWTDIYGSTNVSDTETAGITVPTYFRRKVTCTLSNKFDFSTPILIDTNPANLCYCGPNTGIQLHYTPSSGPSIDSVAISGTTLHVSHLGFGTDSYTQDTMTSTKLKQGVSYTIFTRLSTAGSVGVWIDYDQSGTFDVTEFLGNYTNSANGTITFTVPPTATIGLTGMRVRSAYYYVTINGTQACNKFFGGETEDYLVNIQAGTACSGTPNGGTTYTALPSICQNVTFVVGVKNSTTGVVGLSNQWQESSDGINWSDITGETDDTTIVTGGITTPTYYRRKLTCGSFSAYSTSLKVDTNPSNLCPCSPNTGVTLHSYSGSPSIDSVSILGTNLAYNTISLPTNGYSIFGDTSKIPNLSKTVTYSVFSKFSTNAVAGIWIDYNQNGVFDPSEYTAVTNGVITANTGVLIPSTALTGLTLMRIRAHSSLMAAGAACIKLGGGETEDFYVKIVAAPACAPASKIVASNIGAFTASFKWTPPTTAPSGGYDIYYSTSSSIPTSASASVLVDSATITGLQSSTVYYFWVRANCGSGSTSPWTAFSFTTACAAVTNLPYTESFENLSSVGAGLFPLCWTTKFSGTNFTSASTPVRNNIPARTGTNYVWSRWSSDAWMITPGMQLTAGQTYYFSYYYRASDTLSGFTLNSYVGTNQDTTLLKGTLLGSVVDPTDSSQYKLAYYSFVPATTNVYYFAVQSFCPSFAPWYMLFDDINVSKTNPTLSVSLVNFRGSKVANVNQLTWTTKTETNNSGFELLRSTDGKNFARIATVPSKAIGGNANGELQYVYEDREATNNTYYYQLKQIDKDGKASYSEIILIKGFKSNKIELTSIYPNPVKQSLNIVATSPSAQKLTVLVVDLSGRVISQQQFGANAGDNKFSMNVEGLSTGTYIVKVLCTNGCEAAIQKFIKE